MAKRLALCCFLMGICGSLQAAIMTYSGIDLNPGGKNVALVSHPNSNGAELNFLSTLSGYGTETFEGFSTPAYAPLGLSFGGFNPGSTLTSPTVFGPGQQYSGRVRYQLAGTTNTQGRYTISGNKYFETDNPADPNHPGNTLGDFTITFAKPVTAFGFYALDIGDFTGQLQLTLNRAGDVSLMQLLGGPTTTSGVVFFGITTSDLSHPFTSATFHDTTLNNPAALQDLVGYDNITVGNLRTLTTPEPATALIWGLGLVACGVIGRRRQGKS